MNIKAKRDCYWPISNLLVSEWRCFTFTHLADTFIQSDLQCIQAIHFFISMCVSWELNPQHFALLTQCYHWATGTQFYLLHTEVHITLMRFSICINMNITRAALRENLNKHFLVLFEKNHCQIAYTLKLKGPLQPVKINVCFNMKLWQKYIVQHTSKL